MSKRGEEFKYVQMDKPPGNVFDLTHDVKTTFKMGKLIPTLVMECLPGDKVRIGQENMMRLTPMVAPVMHRIYADTHYFFVPNRLLWENWETWITNEYEAEPPYLESGSGDITPGCLLDYMGVPTMLASAADTFEINALPVKAYELVFDEYYRDENLVTERFTPALNGGNPYVWGTEPFPRSWMHDYFTSALPFAQKGDAATVPLVDSSFVQVQPQAFGDITDDPVFRRVSTGGIAPTGNISASATGAGSITDTGTMDVYFDPRGTLGVDLTSDAVTINTLRRAFKLQEWLEKNARGGTRYVEHILSHFGVRSSDKRLGRPEYLGGISQNIVVSEVLSTAETIDSSDNLVNPVGQMAGHGISTRGGTPVNYFVEEHGILIGITSVLPRTAYFQGLPKMYTRPTPLDYYWPSFAHIGEQEIKMKELYVAAADPEATFGYIPRYSEYKYISDRVHGEFRNTLLYWHMARTFLTEPALNEDFISSDPTSRIFAVEEGDHILAHIINKVKAFRRIPRFSNPRF